LHIGSDTINCFNGLYKFLLDSKQEDIIPLDELKTILETKILECVEKDVSSWYVSFVTTPSYLIKDENDLGVNKSLNYLRKEIELIPKFQKSDGSFGVLWKWYNAYPEYEASKLLWESDIIIEKLLFYKIFKNI